MDVDFDAIAKGMSMAVPFAGHLGLEITSIAEGEATVVLPERQDLTNHVGSQHAGALFTAAETASGAAFVGAFAARMGDVTPLAKSAEIAYEKIANGPITATASSAIDAERGARHARLRGQGRVPLRGRADRRRGQPRRHRHGALARAAQTAGLLASPPRRRIDESHSPAPVLISRPARPAGESGQPTEGVVVSLSGKVAAVTGGGSGIGEATCVRLAEEGARVAVLDIDEGAAQLTAKLAGEGLAVVADVSDTAAVDAALETVEAELGPVDVWVNNAGISGGEHSDRVNPRAEQQLAEMAEGEVDDPARRAGADDRRGVEADARRPPRRHLLRHPRRRPLDGRRAAPASIVNIASICGIEGCTGHPHYSAAKGGILAFTRTVAKELIQQGMRVNAIAPGFVETPLVTGSLTEPLIGAVGDGHPAGPARPPRGGRRRDRLPGREDATLLRRRHRQPQRRLRDRLMARHRVHRPDPARRPAEPLGDADARLPGDAGAAAPERDRVPTPST